jgi:hypothetical protein
LLTAGYVTATSLGNNSPPSTNDEAVVTSKSQKSDILGIETLAPNSNNQHQPTDNSATANVQVTSDNSTHVEVNGQIIPVPENGSVHKTIQSPDGNSVVDVTVENNNGGFTSSSSSFNSTNINSFSSSSNGTTSTIMEFHSSN